MRLRRPGFAFVSILTALCVALPAWGQAPQLQAGSITVNGQCVTVITPNTSATVQVSGTWTGTLAFSGTLTGTFFSVPVTPVSGGVAVTSTTASGQWTSGLALGRLRVCATAAITGTATVALLVTTAFIGRGSGAALCTPAGVAGEVLFDSGAGCSETPAFAYTPGSIFNLGVGGGAGPYTEGTLTIDSSGFPLRVYMESDATANFGFYQVSATPATAVWGLYTSRGLLTAPTAVQNTDVLGKSVV